MSYVSKDILLSQSLNYLPSVVERLDVLVCGWLSVAIAGQDAYQKHHLRHAGRAPMGKEGNALNCRKESLSGPCREDYGGHLGAVLT
ncbi:hypothetical protein GCM10023333_42900 [Ferrimonas pelagia]|uniref:Uncharacterized protein n=1 Tax=Ferrimonas pelagia TaxID=1177826 RepID=A0ABP9FI86_9GAMM